MTAEQYIQAREESMAQQAGKEQSLPNSPISSPREGDKIPVEGEAGSWVYYQGNWTREFDLPKEHPDYMPF